MARGARGNIEILILAVLMVATGLLGSGITLALDDEPAPVNSVRMPSSLDLEGPMTIYADGDPVLEVDEDGAVRLLVDPATLVDLPRPALTAVPAGDACPTGGSAISWSWLGNTTEASACHGAPGAEGPMGPEGRRFLVRMQPFEGPMGAACENGGYLLMMGQDSGNGVATPYDGALDVDEVEHEAPICHGVGRPGPAGPAGSAGPQGDADHGEDGVSSLIHIEPIDADDPSEDACPGGGVYIYTGLDDGDGGEVAGDGDLGPGEWDPGPPQVLCDGEDGESNVTGPAGHNALVEVKDLADLLDVSCEPQGGFRVWMWTDDGTPQGEPDNGERDPGEDYETFAVCHGMDEGGDGGISGTCPDSTVVRGVEEGAVGCTGAVIWPYTVAGPHTLRNIHTEPGGSARGVSLTFDPYGLPIMAYGMDGGVYYARCHDRLCTSMERVQIDEEGHQPAIAVKAPGEVYIGYVQDDDALMARCVWLNCSTHTVISLESPADPGPIRSTSLRIRSDGMPTFVHADDDGLLVVHCSDATCGSRSRVQIYGGASEHVDAAVDWNGDLMIARFGDPTSQEITLVRCTSMDCSLRSSQVLSVSPERAGIPSVAVGSDGNPILTHKKGSPGDTAIVVHHCEDPDCTTYTTQELTDVTRHGYPSIAIGHDGLPAIATSSVNIQNEWQLVKCRTIDCSRWVTTTQTAPGGSWYTDLAIGYDGRPYVAFMSTGGRIHLSILDNPYGVPYWSREG